MRVLVVEQDKSVRESISLILKSEDMNYLGTDNGEEAVELGKIYDFDIILIDPDTKDISGKEVIRRLRLGKVKTPIMVLTAASGIEDRVAALGVGADDVMSKPFHRDELLARMHSIIRRSKGHAESVITVGALSVNLNNKGCKVDGQSVHLTGKEYTMLELLAMRKGTVLTKEMFLNHLYGGMDEPEIKIIDVFICKLRKKLRGASADGQAFIETVWGRGYVLKADAEAPTGQSKKAFNAQAAQVGQKEALSEAAVLRQQMAALHAELGLTEGATLEETMQAMRDYRLRAEREAEDVIGAVPDPVPATSTTLEAYDATQRRTPGFINGVREPVGMQIPLGTFLTVDTNECVIGDNRNNNEVGISKSVATLLEIITYYRGRDVQKTDLIDYMFERPEARANAVKLGAIVSEAQGALTRLVGRTYATLLVQVLSNGNYGMPKLANMLAGPGTRAAALPAPKQN